jgi:hypothetical protein
MEEEEGEENDESDEELANVLARRGCPKPPEERRRKTAAFERRLNKPTHAGTS